MFKQGIIGVDFAICNTDNQAMELSPVPTKIQLGPEHTEGRGAGSKPNIGRQACVESIEDVKRFLSNDTKMLFVTAGMGGGTGTGAAPIIAKTAQEMDILTIGIVTLPFTFEGRRRTDQGHEGLEELKKHVDTLIIISNDKLRQIHGNLSLSEAFSEADDILTTAAKGIAEIITVPGYVNVDFEDVNTVMRGSGVAIMGTAAAEGEDRAKRAVDEAISSQSQMPDRRWNSALPTASASFSFGCDSCGSIFIPLDLFETNPTRSSISDVYPPFVGENFCLTISAVSSSCLFSMHHKMRWARSMTLPASSK
jgi:cell division protein FtsZ